MEAQIYNQKGEAAGKIELPERLFGLRWNGDLVHQVVTALRANARHNTAAVKDRSAVRGGGRKPWRQKGTGRARHGSIRSPIWRGGGVTHGPTTERNYRQKIGKKMKTKALFTLLSQKLRDKEVAFVDQFIFTKPQTREAQTILNQLARAPELTKLNYKKGKRALIVIPKTDGDLHKSFRNIPSAFVITAAQLNPLLTATYKHLVFVRPEEDFKTLLCRV